MFKTREGGVKGSLNNVQKNCTIGIGWLPLETGPYNKAGALQKVLWFVFPCKKDKCRGKEIKQGKIRIVKEQQLKEGEERVQVGKQWRGAHEKVSLCGGGAFFILYYGKLLHLAPILSL